MSAGQQRRPRARRHEMPAYLRERVTMQRPIPETPTDRPLAVDLDGTLVRTDLFIESAIKFVRMNPLHLVTMIGWLIAGGRARLKQELAARVRLDPATLPYDTAFLAFLRGEHARGRRLVLATASDAAYARAVADHLGIFDEVVASDGVTNLKSDAKRARLEARFSTRGFDYAGNETADLKVWCGAHAAVLVNPEPGLAAKVAACHTVAATFGLTTISRAGYIEALRPHQWLKNALVLVPLVLAHKLLEPAALASALIAFVAFCFAASGVYLINDLVDLQDDRAHASKRNRPIASGRVPLKHALALAPVLLAAAFLVASRLPLSFVVILAVYVALTFAYSFLIKRVMLFDVLALAGLYTLRIIAGSAALGIPRSFWLLSFSIFLFFSLSLVKRYIELHDQIEAGNAVGTREPLLQRGRGYRAVDLETLSQLGIASGMMAVLVLALYIDSPVVASLYRNPEAIWLICPLVLYLVCRFWILARRGEMHDDPVVFAMRDWRTQAVAAACVVLLIAAALL